MGPLCSKTLTQTGLRGCIYSTVQYYQQNKQRVPIAQKLWHKVGALQCWEFAHRFTERITCFLRKNEQIMSDLSESLLVTHFWWATWAIRSHCSLLVSDLSESLTVTHLSWANWVIHSQWLICPEQSERIAHNCSFDLSDLSEWANEGWLNERTCLYCDANGGLRLVSRWTILG